MKRIWNANLLLIEWQNTVVNFHHTVKSASSLVLIAVFTLVLSTKMFVTQSSDHAANQDKLTFK
jgi:hypothetical protein